MMTCLCTSLHVEATELWVQPLLRLQASRAKEMWRFSSDRPVRHCSQRHRWLKHCRYRLADSAALQRCRVASSSDTAGAHVQECLRHEADLASSAGGGVDFRKFYASFVEEAEALLGPHELVAQGRFKLSQECARRGDYDDALRHAQQGLRTWTSAGLPDWDIGYQSGRCTLGQVYEAMGRVEEAVCAACWVAVLPLRLHQRAHECWQVATYSDALLHTKRLASRHPLVAKLSCSMARAHMRTSRSLARTSAAILALAVSLSVSTAVGLVAHSRLGW